MAESPSDFIRARRWVNEQGASVFPSFALIEWCIRRHRVALVESGQPLVRRSASGAPMVPSSRIRCSAFCSARVARPWHGRRARG